jgi:hypothetical protein
MWWDNKTDLTANRQYRFVWHFLLLQNLTVALLAVSTNTNGLYWGFQNVQYWCHGLSYRKDKDFLSSEDRVPPPFKICV